MADRIIRLRFRKVVQRHSLGPGSTSPPPVYSPTIGRGALKAGRRSMVAARTLPPASDRASRGAAADPASAAASPRRSPTRQPPLSLYILLPSVRDSAASVVASNATGVASPVLLTSPNTSPAQQWSPIAQVASLAAAFFVNGVLPSYSGDPFLRRLGRRYRRHTDHASASRWVLPANRSGRPFGVVGRAARVLPSSRFRLLLCSACARRE